MVHLLRHAETDCAAEERFCGQRHDPPLNARGRAMAHAVAAAYASGPWEAIYTSPLLRARQTGAAVAAATGVSVEVDAGLAELDYGAWDDLSKRAVAALPGFRTWLADPASTAPPGGETAREVAVRAAAVLGRIRARHAGAQVLVVTHKATIRILVCHYLGINLARFRWAIAAPVASLTCLALHDRWAVLLRLGDIAHLPHALRESLTLDGGACAPETAP